MLLSTPCELSGAFRPDVSSETHSIADSFEKSLGQVVSGLMF